ncbi:MAG TPA: alpha/beta hydrolase [Candidatus Baltobacteraceae bacterium]|nr:alpha/beta hydrolase [Candidatus Baltobacteraceae bacterium]
MPGQVDVAKVFAQCAAAALLLTGPARASDVYAHPQRLIDVGAGRRMNIYCTGRGSPPVILDAGGGGSTRSWRYVQPRIATFTRVCSYDRAGAGFSDPGPLPRTTSAIVSDLHTLLERAGIAAPYILVGHSMGGYDMRLYADRYPAQVRGMVLVDPSDEHQDARLNALLPRLRRFDALQITMLRTCEDAPRLCPPQNGRAVSAPAWADALSELQNTHNADLSELEHAHRAPYDFPLIVLTGGAQFKRYQRLLGASDAQVAAAQRAWSAMHDEQARLSVRGVNEHVPGAGHDIQLDRPDAVVQAVRRVISESTPI